MYTLFAQKNHKTLCAYSAETKTDCFYKFDRNHFRKECRFFIVESTQWPNVCKIEHMPRGYPYQVHKLV